jgi:Domain of unknown function (DUF1883)
MYGRMEGSHPAALAGKADGANQMEFTYWDLGHLTHGAVVEVNLTGTAANVQLLDSSNFAAYKSRQQYRYFGGQYTSSPVRIPVPVTGHWFIAIDYGGNSGRGTASIKVLSRV